LFSPSLEAKFDQLSSGADPKNHVEIDETLLGGATRGLGRAAEQLAPASIADQ
jgi:hypothetical protein